MTGDVPARRPRPRQRDVFGQAYESYPLQEHAAWRFVMRHLVRVLSGAAPPIRMDLAYSA